MRILNDINSNTALIITQTFITNTLKTYGRCLEEDIVFCRHYFFQQKWNLNNYWKHIFKYWRNPKNYFYRIFHAYFDICKFALDLMLKSLDSEKYKGVRHKQCVFANKQAIKYLYFLMQIHFKSVLVFLVIIVSHHFFSRILQYLHRKILMRDTLGYS